MNDLSDLLIRLELQLIELGYLDVQQTGDHRIVLLKNVRLEQWCIAAIERSGFARPTITALLAQTSCEKRWRLLRSLLPEKALQALQTKIAVSQTDRRETANFFEIPLER